MGFIFGVLLMYVAIGIAYQVFMKDFGLDWKTAKEIITWPKYVFVKEEKTKDEE
jgi:hypothetical protein